MGWRVWGTRLVDTDLTSGTNVFQPFKPNSNIMLRAIRTWFIFYNDPTITSLTMSIYSNDGGTPGQKIFDSSTTHTKAQMITLENGVKEVYFQFDDVAMRAEDTYHFVPRGTGYSSNWDTSGLAWMKGFPDPVYRPAGFDFESLGNAPYTLYAIGANL